MATITLDRVSFTYPGTNAPVISDLNLSIRHGSAHALLGASGAGKTTILGLLSGLLHPSQGNILINGRDVSAEGARQRNMALVFQFPVTYESISVLENLMLPLVSRGWNKSEAASRAKEIAIELGIDHVLKTTPDRLPLFEKQLVAIGKSLVRDDVDLVLLDEPLTAVEPAIKWRLRQTLNKFQAAHGLTMVYVTHDQTEALTFADTVSVMADGRILQTGPPEEIYLQPATQFVGEFIGSLGMQFVDCEITSGQLLVGGENLKNVDLDNGNYTLGVRPDWLEVRDQGPWKVLSKQILGTQAGEAISLHQLSHVGSTLLARHVGELESGANVGIELKQFTLFKGEEAVAHG